MTKTDYKRIRKTGKILTTKRRAGGPRYLLNPIHTPDGPILMDKFDASIGLKANSSDFLLYKSNFGPDQSFSFSINTSKNHQNPLDKTYILPFQSYTPNYEMTVYWGDGSTTILTANTPLTEVSHTYPSAGAYTITLVSLEGKMPRFNSNLIWTNQNNQKLISVNNPFLAFDLNCPNSQDMSATFATAGNLIYIPGNLLINNPNSIDFTAMFVNCTALRYIPENLFWYTTKPADYAQCFDFCYNIKKIPQRLMARTNPTDVSFMFRDCSKIENNIVLEELFGRNSLPGINASHLFSNCILTTGNAVNAITFFGMDPYSPNNYGTNMLKGCTQWEEYELVDSGYTAYPTPNIDWLSCNDANTQWLMANDENALVLN